ncbi:peptide N-acetyl-beta-D-glucosaminyl asparaginase amidase A-domain-containing protein [Crucibulum laeve]|uniref:Peptide N-acetyl-beta-D-glucosaminyl asparaginase amidase A-domain-containing protein n=1 Tax=Crucibulum laeve TaxID=68775 RepID=A0A5C3MAV3_9AGAR|nr:peptide N-acetyl-beta-D-glucosaminyl asparaginase amidase A-domain-containing protein [Crucibulum laeve]
MTPRMDVRSCTVELISHSFGDGSYNAPAVVKYKPPTGPGCGKIGDWVAISVNLTVYSIGTQYDRLSAIYLSHSEIWRSSSAEPTKTGTIWTTIKDVTHFAPIFAREGDLMMDFSNIIDHSLLLDAAFDVTLQATFYSPSVGFSKYEMSSDLIIPLSNGSPTLPNFFSLVDDIGATTNFSLPENTIAAFVEIFASGNANEEFWYTNTPDQYLSYFSGSAGLIGKGPFREIQILVDDQLAGVIWPYAVIYTGGITPSNWRPLASYGAYDAPTYWIDITPFLPILLSNTSHSITLRVQGQGTHPTFNSNWFISGSIHARLGSGKTTGAMLTYDVPALDIQTMGGSKANSTVWTSVKAKRHITIKSDLSTSEGKKTVIFNQNLEYVNNASYANDGWVQWVEQETDGISVATHGDVKIFRDAFSYPLQVFSNYSAYSQVQGGYGSEINQTFARAIKPPTGRFYSILSNQHAKGEIEMDDWPGLRHAIRGTGSTNQTFAFIDGRGETYFRDISAKNDGWVKDHVWGTLREQNSPVPNEQLFGPNGGPGFRR